MTGMMKGFAQNLLSGEAFSQIEAELESALKDKDGPSHADKPAAAPGEAPPRSEEAGAAAAVPDGDAAARLAKLEARLAEKSELCAAKDEQIAAVLAEGEGLSIRQAEQERQIRKLKQQTREAQSAAETLTSELEDTRSKLAAASRTLADRDAANAGQTAEMKAVAVAASEARETERQTEKADYAALRTKHDALVEEHRALTLSVAQFDGREAVAAGGPDPRPRQHG